MSAKEIIQDILTEKGLKIEQFATKIDSVPTTLYAILKGKTERISRSLAHKINNVYPEYTIEFLREEDEETVIPIKKIKLNKRSTSLTLQYLAVLVANNEEDLMQEKIFSNVIERRVLQELIRIAEEENGLENFLKKGL